MKCRVPLIYGLGLGMGPGIHYSNGFAQNLLLTADPGAYVKCYCGAGLKVIPSSRREVSS